jgi:alcohol dehydrogenase, propanol-preferring
MQAIRLTAWERPAELVEIPMPEPGPGEVLVRVAGAGLCHSDLHLMHWRAGALPYDLPFTLGHEVAGTVAALGPGAEALEPGEPVLVYGPWGCGRCRACSVGAEHLCESPPRGRGAGLGRDGGLAEYVVVPSPRLTVPLDGLDPVAAAPLADAGLTPYHAIRRAQGILRPGAGAIVVGVGGLGHVAVQLLKGLGRTRVVAVDRRDEALELATRGGADVALQAAGLTAGELRLAAGPRGAALVLDCVGTDETLSLAAGAVSPGGHVSVLGLSGGTFPMRFGGVPLETSVIFSNWGTRAELAEVVALARDGAISVDVERISLAGVPTAYERLAGGGGHGRLVAVPAEGGSS